MFHAAILVDSERRTTRPEATNLTSIRTSLRPIGIHLFLDVGIVTRAVVKDHVKTDDVGDSADNSLLTQFSQT
jgi:hypothetical protein